DRSSRSVDAQERRRLVQRVGRRPDRLGQPALAARTARRARSPLQATREEPVRLRPRAAGRASRRRRVARRPPDRPHDRRHVQRPRGSADGRARQPLRSQRPARACLSRPGRPSARAQPAAGQPRAPDTHWWDGSQIYGSDPTFARAIRSGEDGLLRITAEGLLPEDVETHVDLRGVAGNFWVGLALLHALFMLEHNAICKRLHAEYPELDDQTLYEKARLVNAALMAKIHTVDWTPAIIAHPTSARALRANWWGILGERFDKRFGRRTKRELFHGIPGSPKQLFGVPYALTEEFVAVYRMHPLIPDDYTFRAVADDRVLQERTFDELNALHVRECLEQIPIGDAFYPFGIA